MQVREYIEQLAHRFAEARLAYGHGTANALDEAVYLVYGYLDIDFDRNISSVDDPLPASLQSELDGLATRRIEEYVPIAYLVGKAWFAGRCFNCDPRAIIPRSPIAELLVNDFQPLLRQTPRRILDLCTGGGCIGIAAALQFPQAKVDLVDLSPECLALAEENIQLHDVAGRVQVLQSDLFACVDQRYELIVSNPPYVSAEEVEQLPEEYRHEPDSALLSADAGLAIPLRILREAGQYLSEDGVLVMEVGLSAERLQARLPEIPFLWLDFEEGGEGVLALSASQLLQYSSALN